LQIASLVDGRSERPVPQLCMICHGGLIPSQASGVPAFGTAAQVKLNARFLPFDHRFFTFPTNPVSLSKADQKASIKKLNQQIVIAAAPSTEPVPANDPVRRFAKWSRPCTSIALPKGKTSRCQAGRAGHSRLCRTRTISTRR
jgi:hypothetical protein